MARTATLDTREDRRRRGRQLRDTAPRSSHGAWEPLPTRQAALDVLRTQEETRIADLIPVRHARMAVSPFTFFRGAAAVMAMDLASTPVTGLQVQACGDAHVTNFGEFATPERNVVFDINDFDETLPGPWEWDVKRLCASLQVVTRQEGFTPAQSRRVVTTAVREYRERMDTYAGMRALEVWYDRIHIEDVVAHFPKSYRPRVLRHLVKVHRKTHQRAAAKLRWSAEDGDRFVEEPPLLVRLDHTEYEMAEVVTMLDNYRLTLTGDRRALFDRFELVDVARKVVGVGSVGTSCWVVLFEGPRHRDGDPLILQIKEAQPSVLEAYVGPSPFEHQGMRVVEGQRLTQAASDIFLGWTQGPRSGRHYYVRQLWDVKGQGDPTAMDPDGLVYYGALCAWGLARAHARTGDAVQIAGYLGSGDVFDEAIAEFADRYAQVNEEDHRAFVAAIAAGEVEVAAAY